MNQDVKEMFHVPVLLNEVIECLNIRSKAWYIDATIGGGGYTEPIIERGGLVLGIDRDDDAIEYVKKKFASKLKANKLILRHGNFALLDKYLKEANIDKPLGIIFDLGMSTYQIKNSGRGFSFRGLELLDMRMDKKQSLAAEFIVNHYSEKDLYEIFRKFGEENLAREIANAVCRARTLKPITSTKELRDIVLRVYKKAGIKTKIDPATRTFQALRIEVNQELDNLQTGLNKALKVLGSGGRLAVISFHSLEDRIVKRFFREKLIVGEIQLINHKPIIASEEELRLNSAARSAKLRAIEKI